MGNVWLGVVTKQYGDVSYEVDPNKVAPGTKYVEEGTQVLSAVRIALTSAQELSSLAYQIDFEAYKFVSDGSFFGIKQEIESTTNVTDLLPVTGSD